ncbi:MAG: DUF1343 domain-containing protein [Bacteroidetes bacterium]|nr:DUF1343 domain-containing protein [Bacteroidota bacterium]
MNVRLTLKILCWILPGCLAGQASVDLTHSNGSLEQITVGAERTELYFPLLENKQIAIVTNQTSMVGNVHLVDTLFISGFDIRKVFGPEHGFRGQASDGEKVADGRDPKTGLPVVSLYGAKRKPLPEDLNGLDLVIFDIQDVGTRFYTYISTMSYVMEACAENDVAFMVLDRPNPNGDFVDGPVLDTAFSSFVGLHPVPAVHGMTVGEYAQMVNGEGWLKNGIQCALTVIPVENYDHTVMYQLPVAPSPNLPNMTAIYLYPSLCFFEGTIISVGRGTDFPFQVIGHPDYALGSFAFTPRSVPGASLHPPYEGETCYGQSLKGYAEHVVLKERHLHLDLLISYYDYFKDKTPFFTAYFKKLAGTNQLQQQIEAGKTEKEIRDSWQDGLAHFKRIREKYLLYPDCSH